MRRSVSAIFVAALFLALSLLAIDGCSQSRTQSAAEVHRISKEDLRSHIGDPDTTLIDVRQEGDWQQSGRKIKGAVREDPMQAVESWQAKYPKDGKIVLYCA